MHLTISHTLFYNSAEHLSYTPIQEKYKYVAPVIISQS